MSKTIKFGQIGNSPVVIADGYAHIWNKGWRKLPDGRLREIIPLRTRTYLKRFGRLVSDLPDALKRVAPALQIVGDANTVGFCRSGSRCEVIQQSKAKVTHIEPFLEKRRREQCAYDLGRHHYSSGPGFSWTCEYRIIRLDDEGEVWDLQATSEDSDGYESMGTHSLEAAQEYFDSVGFSVSTERWEAMGAQHRKDFHSSRDKE